MESLFSIRDTTNRCNEHKRPNSYISEVKCGAWSWNCSRTSDAGKVYYGHHSEPNKSYTRKKAAKKIRGNKKRISNTDINRNQKKNELTNQRQMCLHSLYVIVVDEIKYPLWEKCIPQKSLGNEEKQQKQLIESKKKTTELMRNIWMKRKTKSRSNQNRQTEMCVAALRAKVSNAGKILRRCTVLSVFFFSSRHALSYIHYTHTFHSRFQLQFCVAQC